MESNSIGPIEFPQWLGKNSNRNKRHRLLQSLHTHVHLEVSASLEALNMDYLPYLRRSIVNPLASSNHEKSAKKMDVSCTCNTILKQNSNFTKMLDHFRRMLCFGMT